MIKKGIHSRTFSSALSMVTRIVFILILCLFLIKGCAASRSAAERQSDVIELESIDSLDDVKDDPGKLLTLAQQYLGRQNFDEALDCVRLALIAESSTINSDRAYYLRGKAFADILNFHRDLKKAAAAFRMVISSPPESEYDKLAQKELNRIIKRT